MSKYGIYILLFFSVTAFAQRKSLYQKTYTKKDGLEIDQIAALQFDNDGFLWLGGSNLDDRSIVNSDKKLTLQRFNGHTFHSITLPEHKNTITNIEQIYKRKDGKFYVVCKLKNGHSILLFDPYTTIFTDVNFKGFGNAADGISNIYSYKNKDYLLIQNDRDISLKALNSDLTSDEIFSFTSTENKFLAENFSRILPFEKFIIITDDNFDAKVFDWNGNLLKIIDAVEKLSKRPTYIAIDEHFVNDGKHFVFLKDNNHLYRIDEDLKHFVPAKDFSLQNLHLNTFSDAHNNTKIFASVGNNISFNTYNSDGFLQNHTVTFNKINGIEVISKNLKNDLWLSTNGKLHYFKFPNTTVKRFLNNKQLRAIKPLDNSNYLISTEADDFFKLNLSDNTIEPYRIEVNNKVVTSSGARNFIIRDNFIYTNGGSGIIKINTKTQKAEIYKHYPIICLEELNDSTIVYGTNGYNLMKFNTNTNLHSSLLQTDSLYIYDIAVRKQNNFIAAATDKGLLTFDYDSKTTKFYNRKTDIEDTFTLMTDYHKDYGYLLGSRTGIITAFNPDDESFTTIYRDELKAGIATILFDDDVWWINTFNGIVAFNPKDQSTTRFSEKDGFSHYEGNRYSAIKTKDGLFFGMINGLNYFNPKVLKTKKDSASLELLKVRHFNTTKKAFEVSYNRNAFKNGKTIILPSENRSLDIDFGLKFTNAVDNGYSYKYRLNEKDWEPLKNKNSIQFPNLASGQYVLEIEASDYSGNKIGESLFLKINSKVLFYKTWWFYLLISLAIISVLLILLKQTNMRRVLQERFALELIKSQEKERKRIASELHDSVSQQLTLIKRKAQSKNQDEISTLTNNTLEEVRHISRGLFPPLLKQLGLTESIEQLALDIDENNDIFVSTDIENIDTYLTEDQSLHLYRFIQENINNILKHSEAKAFSINIIKQKTLILVKIKDNGKGFNVSNAKSKNSLGLKTLEERIRILNGEIIMSSALNKGTETIAKIPI